MRRLLLLLLLPILLAAPPAWALDSAPARSPRATVTLLADAAAIAPGTPFRLALRQRLAPGWHTYWTNPGDAGAPPEVTLTLPEGAVAAPMRFPAPSRIPYGPLVNFGYEGEAVFTIPVTPPATLRPGETFTVLAAATWLVCERICVPEEASFRLDIPVEAAPRAAAATALLFTAAEAAEPRAAPFTARLGFAGRAGALEIAGPDIAAGAVRDAFFFPTEWGVIDNAAPQVMSVRDGAITLSLVRGPAEALPPRITGIIAITDAAGVRGAYAIDAVNGAVPASFGVAPLWQLVLLAALGGLVLNLMPCVFPILAIKALSLARLSGEARGAVRGHAASYTAGVVLAFLAIGGLLIGLRAAGGVAGWGFQFTSPVFVAGMAWLMLAVGLNLSGVFSLGGPVSAGSSLAARGGHAGAFFTGALAVLVATPCTAPFMATAIGAAIALPPIAALAIFAALGLGMALPYALLAAVPAAARLLPRPGAWMLRLRQALAFPMYGFAAWLVFILAQQAGPDGVLVALAGGLSIAAGAWLLGLAQSGGRRFGLPAAALAVLAALALLPGLNPAAPPRAAAQDAWSAPRLAALRAEGRPVFVNLTAAWCISCKWNERTVLATDAVRRAFAERNVALLTGDWTNGDAAISELLRAHRRDGVPLYLLYPAGGAAPLILPQILTEGIVLRALAEAGDAK